MACIESAVFWSGLRPEKDWMMDHMERLDYDPVEMAALTLAGGPSAVAPVICPSCGSEERVPFGFSGTA